MGDETNAFDPKGLSPEQLEREAGSLLDRCRCPEGCEADVQRLEQVLGQLPDDRCPYERGYVAYQRNRDGEAIDYLYRAAIEASRSLSAPVEGETLFRWILPFILDPLPELWRKLAEAFGEKWPDSAPVYLLLGYAELHSDNAGVAADNFAKALDVDETYWPASSELGNIHFDERAWQRALGCYKQAIRYAADDEKPILYFNLALAHLRLQQYKKAVVGFRECLELDPDFRYARGNLGKALMRSGKYEQAVEFLTEAVRCNADDEEPRKHLAKVLRRLGRYAEAAEVIRKGPLPDQPLRDQPGPDQSRPGGPYQIHKENDHGYPRSS